jgi:hypothetical protein
LARRHPRCAKCVRHQPNIPYGETQGGEPCACGYVGWLLAELTLERSGLHHLDFATRRRQAGRRL